MSTSEERDTQYQEEIIGYVAAVPVAGVEGAAQLFYYCVAHRDKGFSGGIELRPFTRNEDNGYKIVCQLCHTSLSQVAYIEAEILRRNSEAQQAS
jgi:hypothetical protein